MGGIFDARMELIGPAEAEIQWSEVDLCSHGVGDYRRMLLVLDGRVGVSCVKSVPDRCGDCRRLALAENCSAATARIQDGR